MLDLMIISLGGTLPFPYSMVATFAGIFALIPELVIHEMVSTFAVRKLSLFIARIGSNKHHYLNIVQWWFEKHESELIEETGEWHTKILLVKKFLHYRFKRVALIHLYHPLPYELTFDFEPIKAKYGGAGIEHNKGDRITVLELEPEVRDWTARPTYAVLYGSGYDAILYGTVRIKGEINAKLARYGYGIEGAKARIDLFRQRHDFKAPVMVE